MFDVRFFFLQASVNLSPTQKLLCLRLPLPWTHSTPCTNPWTLLKSPLTLVSPRHPNIYLSLLTGLQGALRYLTKLDWPTKAFFTLPANWTLVISSVKGFWTQDLSTWQTPRPQSIKTSQGFYLNRILRCNKVIVVYPLHKVVWRCHKIVCHRHKVV